MKKQLKPKRRSQKLTKKPALKPHRFGRLRFLPAIAIALLASFFAYQPNSMQSPTRDVLAYATNVSPSGLLSATNTERAHNSVASLGINSRLSAAAQAKADDMVVRDYWAHATPDGRQPWTFVSDAGYSYTAAGENLAYGFITSSDTITGWMNSPPHKTNMLSAGFTEVGFGIANSPNFTGKGQQTIVVAMYAKPQNAAPTAAPKPATTKPAPTPAATKPATTQQPAPTPAPAPEAIAEPVKETPEEEVTVSTPANSDVLITTAQSTNIERIRLVNSSWLNMAVVTLAVCGTGILWLIHKGFHMRRYILAGEHFAAKHLHIDLAVLSIIYFGFVLFSDSGVVR